MSQNIFTAYTKEMNFGSHIPVFSVGTEMCNTAMKQKFCQISDKFKTKSDFFGNWRNSQDSRDRCLGSYVGGAGAGQNSCTMRNTSNENYFNFDFFDLFQDRLKSQEDLITSFSSKIEELQVRDKKREMALEAANSLLDKELTRVSTFVEDKVRQIFKKYMYNDTKY